MDINLRVYGILHQKGHVLMSLERIANREILKFPGGGVHPKESLTDALMREIKEEMNCSLTQLQHFYTTEAYVPSWLAPHERVLSVFYTMELIELLNQEPFALPLNPEHTLEWVECKETALKRIDLPIEQTVFKKLLFLCPQ